MPSMPSEHGRHRCAALGDTASPQFDSIWSEMQRRWRTGDQVPAEAYLSGALAVHGESQAVDLIYGEFCLREELGERPSAEEYQSRFPRFARELRRQIVVHRA